MMAWRGMAWHGVAWHMCILLLYKVTHMEAIYLMLMTCD